MKQLWLITGSPGSGKSSLIKELGWEKFCLSADSIRLLYSSPILDIDGQFSISQKRDRDVWNFLFYLLEQRMSRGEFTVIDATHSRSKDWSQYKKLVHQYKYRMYAISLRDVDIDTCKERNQKRYGTHAFVPPKVIDNMYARFESHKIPNYVTVVDKNKVFDYIDQDPIDYTGQYDKIHYIGDIHGCWEPLQKYFRGGLKEDELYIFIGDFLDRGIQNKQVFEFIYDIHDLPNVCLIEGNHEIWQWNWATDKEIKNKGFVYNTIPEISSVSNAKQKARSIYRKLWQLSYHKFHGQTILVTHGGIPTYPDHIAYLPTEQIIKGVGKYEDMPEIAKKFDADYNGRIVQIFGHRNIQRLPTKINDSVYSLEGKVEFGGHLRVLTLDKFGEFKTYEIKNDTYNEDLEFKPRFSESINKDNFIEELRKSNKVSEKSLGDNISSFVYKRQVFYKQNWDENTNIARGLFVNTNTKEIVARSYPKFFYADETEETKLDNLYNKLKFPISVYKKYNGFLGIIGWNSEKQDLFVATKSTNKGSYKGWFDEILSKYNIDKIKDVVRNGNLSLVFEVIDPINDPHIIKYKDREIILLDAIFKQINFKKLEYYNILDLADSIGCKCKEKITEINSWEEYISWNKRVEKQENDRFEGFVLEDQNNFMLKKKLPYYNEWKFLRKIKDRISNGCQDMTQFALLTPTQNRFVGFIKDKTKEELESKSIIQLRDEFIHETRL